MVVPLQMQHTAWLFHMDVCRSAGYSNADDEIRSPWVLRNAFGLYPQVFEGNPKHPCNLARDLVDTAPCPLVSCTYVWFYMDINHLGFRVLGCVFA